MISYWETQEGKLANQALVAIEIYVDFRITKLNIYNQTDVELELIQTELEYHTYTECLLEDAYVDALRSEIVGIQHNRKQKELVV